MHIVGIIAEFNPLHTGHKYLIENAKKIGKVVCVISGNFVQRGDTAIFEKSKRAEMALKCGADLVLELPTPYAMSTAQNFALGAVSILDAVGCDILMFGSECGDINLLEKASEILNSKEFSEKLPPNLTKGITFAKARQITAEECGLQKDILNGANNNLAIEYITACKNIGSKMSFKTVARRGAMHDSDLVDGEFVSASFLRQKILEKDFCFAKKYLACDDLSLMDNISDIKRIQNTILGILRTKNKDDFSNLPDLSEGVENKLYSAIKKATSLEELYDIIKVKRYTHARVRRLVLSAFLGIDNSFFMKKSPYLRVLGFNKNGQEIIKNAKIKGEIPVIIRAGEVDKLSFMAQKMFALECKATDLYALSLEKPLECGLEYKKFLIKTEC